MTPDALRALRRDLAAIQERPWRFVYSPAGLDGFPVILLGRKRLPARELTALLRWGRRRAVIRGTIWREGGRLVLQSPVDDRLWFIGLQRFFGGEIPALAEARLR